MALTATIINSKPKLITARQISEFAGVHILTIYDWAAAGKLPGLVRLGRALRWPETVLDNISEHGLASGTGGHDAAEKVQQ